MRCGFTIVDKFAVTFGRMQSEFVVDFATILPGLAKPKIRSRIVLTPEHAKRLMLSLQDNIARYEASNGLIGLTPTAAEESTMPLGFCNKGEA